MDPDAFEDAVRDANRTALSRLGSSKSLYADTEGEMEPRAVLAAWANAEQAVAQIFRAWAEETESAGAEAFSTAATGAHDRYESVSRELDDHDYDPGEAPRYLGHLKELEGTIERLGGLAAHALVANAKASQATGFFTGRADPQTARIFREMGETFDEQLDLARTSLVDQCTDDEEWARAHEAATGTIDAAYDEYVDRLEDMGVNPKPVC